MSSIRHQILAQLAGTRQTTRPPSGAPAPAAAIDRAPAMRGEPGGFLLQLQRSHGNRFVQRLVEQHRPTSGAGIPDGIKAALERRSGVDLSGARVHYNSPWPASLDAFACTRGEEIHIAPGQERQLAHEAWHVVQQRQGRVRPTRDMGGVAINDDVGLEREADSASRSATYAPDRLPAEPVGDHRHTRAGNPAPVQLSAMHVDRRLTKYRKRNKPISDTDLSKILAVFADWETLQEEADEFGGRKGAGKVREKAKNTIKKAVIETLNNNDEISVSVRKKLVELWNRGTPAGNQVVFREPPKPAETVKLSPGISQSWQPLSPLALTFKYTGLGESESESESTEQSEPEKEEKTQQKSKKLVSGKGSKAEEEEVPIVDTAEKAAVTIRSFTTQEERIPKGFKIIWGPGMFEKGPHEDIVYVLLEETEPGVVVREGKVAKWTVILKELLDKYGQDPARLFHLIQAGLTGRAPSDPTLALACGAMICDVKHGIDEWIQLLSELYPMLTKAEELDDQELFMEWYEYAAKGGRDLRGREPRTSYRKERNRVKTIEFTRPTLIPSRGGFRFPNEEIPKTHPSADKLWELIIEFVDDPVMLWPLAMTNRYFYNKIAEWYRKTRQLEPKKQ